MKKTELEKLNIITEDGIFTPIYIYNDIKPIINDEKITDYEYIGFQMKMTAEESYNEWLKNKNLIQPTELEILKEKNALLEMALLEMAELQSKEYENRTILENAVLDLANTIAGGK